MRKQTSHWEENYDRKLAPTEKENTLIYLKKILQTVREEMKLLFILFINLIMEKNLVELKGEKIKKIENHKFALSIK